MTHVRWTYEMLGRFLKAIAAAKNEHVDVFEFDVDTTRGTARLPFSVDYAEYLADHLTDVLAPPTVQ